MKRQKIVKILTCFYLLPLAAMVVFNTVNSLLRTTYFDLYQDVEAARYKWDDPLLVILFTVGLLVLLFYFRRVKWFKSVDKLKGAICFAGIFSLIVALLFRAVATCDSVSISNSAIAFLKGDYQAFEQGEYLYMYPFQLGITALLELVYRVFGIENFMAFQLINIVCIMVLLRLLNLITAEIFEDERICGMEAALSIGMLPLFLFSTFVYGDIIGWAFGMSAIFYVVRYLKRDDWRDILKAGLLLMVGVIVKSNINILVVAAVTAVILNSIWRKNYKILAWVPVLILLSQLGVAVVNGIYVQRAGLEEYPGGIPKIAWIAMSMQEADEGGYACGWYNGYNWAVYEGNGFDRGSAVQACVEDLKGSLQRFIHEQRYAIDFFYKKFTSQWNAPTFQAMITNEWSTRHAENISPVAEFFIYGTGRSILYGIMNVYHFFIFLCTAFFFILRKGKWNLPIAYFMLNIFGGFLFHMIWEAQARYILGYFVLMLPLAGSGCCWFFEWIEGTLNDIYYKLLGEGERHVS